MTARVVPADVAEAMQAVALGHVMRVATPSTTDARYFRALPDMKLGLTVNL